MTTAVDEPLHEILARMVTRACKRPGTKERQPWTRDLIAKELGVGTRVLSHWLEKSPGRRCPAEMLPTICRVIEDYEVLDVLDGRANRIAFQKPHVQSSDPVGEIKHVQRLVSEVSGALEELSKTLEDGIVEEHEVKATVRELEDVIRECSRLEHWLRKREEHDRGKPKRK